jgi:hypothetical protein
MRPYATVVPSIAVTAQAAVSAVAQLTLMLAIATAYVMLARRFRLLWHPVSVVVAVGTVAVLYAVLTAVMFGGGFSAAPSMASRSAIGGFGWGVVIAAMVWIARRGYAWWTKA